MARQVVLDEQGLPVKGSKNPSGRLTIILDEQGWAELSFIKALWEGERGQILSITEVVRACVRQVYLARKVDKQAVPESAVEQTTATTSNPRRRKKGAQ